MGGYKYEVPPLLVGDEQPVLWELTKDVHDKIVDSVRSRESAELVEPCVPVIGHKLPLHSTYGHHHHNPNLYPPMPVIDFDEHRKGIGLGEITTMPHAVPHMRQMGKSNLAVNMMRYLLEERREMKERIEEPKIGFLLWEQPSLSEYITRYFKEPEPELPTPHQVWNEDDIFLHHKPRWVKTKLAHIIRKVFNEQTEQEIPHQP